jgi:hypothetical protein
MNSGSFVYRSFKRMGKGSNLKARIAFTCSAALLMIAISFAVMQKPITDQVATTITTKVSYSQTLRLTGLPIPITIQPVSIAVPTASPITVSAPVVKKPAPTVTSIAPAAPIVSAAPVTQPAAHAAISFSADSCYVTANGTPGLTFVAGAENGHKGGDVTYIIPSSGTLTVSSGGREGYNAYGNVTAANGTVLASAESPITAATFCPAPTVN